MADSDLQINIKTVAEVKAIEDFKNALEKAHKQAKEFGQDVSELEKNLREVDTVLATDAVKSIKFADALGQVGEKAKAVQDAKEKADQASGAMTGLAGRLASGFAGFLAGGAISAGITVGIELLDRLGGEILQLLRNLNLLPDASEKVDTVTKSFQATERTAAGAAKAVEKLTKSFDEASRAFETLRKKQDELGDAGLAEKLAGVDLSEALGEKRGGISSDEARKRRAALRLENAQNKNASERTAISDEQMVVEAQVAKSSRNLDTEDFRQRRQDKRREDLLHRASKLLQVPVEKLRDPEVFDREYQAAIERTTGDIIPGEFDTVLQTPEDRARRADLETLKELSIRPSDSAFPAKGGIAREGGLLRSQRKGVTRANEQLGDVTAMAQEKLPELDRRREIVDRRDSAGTMSTAADLIKAADHGKTGSASLQEVSQAIQQFGQGNAKSASEMLGVVRQLITQQQAHGREIELLRKQTRTNNPY